MFFCLNLAYDLYVLRNKCVLGETLNSSVVESLTDTFYSNSAIPKKSCNHDYDLSRVVVAVSCGKTEEIKFANILVPPLINSCWRVLGLLTSSWIGKQKLFLDW